MINITIFFITPFAEPIQGAGLKVGMESEYRNPVNEIDDLYLTDEQTTTDSFSNFKAKF